MIHRCRRDGPIVPVGIEDGEKSASTGRIAISGTSTETRLSDAAQTRGRLGVFSTVEFLDSNAVGCMVPLSRAGSEVARLQARTRAVIDS